MNAGFWTGGQYSLVRALLGLYLAFYFLLLLTSVVPLDLSPSPEWIGSKLPTIFSISSAPLFQQALCVLGFAASLALAVGAGDRFAALFLWVTVGSFMLQTGGSGNLGLLLVTLLLLAQWMMRSAPYGSLRAKGRIDPAGDWRFQNELYTLLWLVLPIAYGHFGMRSLGSEITTEVDGAIGGIYLILSFLLLISIRVQRLQYPAWLLSFGSALLIGIATEQHFQAFGLLVYHLFIFNPAWIPSKRPLSWILYDGECALCHGWVRFVLSETTPYSVKPRFAPLQAAQAMQLFESNSRVDSIVAVRGDSSVLTRSDAVIAILAMLGGFWRVFSFVLKLIPRPVRDSAYDLIARYRKKIFGSSPQLCPLMPENLRSIFVLD